jgi:hypothetical protein
MPIIDLNKVVGTWTDQIKTWNFYERMELQRLLTASFERDYDDLRRKGDRNDNQK